MTRKRDSQGKSVFAEWHDDELDTIFVPILFFSWMLQSAGAAEYTKCISADGWDSPNKCSGYDTKQSEVEAWVILERWEMQSTPFIVVTYKTTLAWSGST